MSTFGPYLLLGRLGAGGMGEVHLARDPRLEREVALKMLPARFADDPERMALLRSEALVIASLNHPNIATVYGLEEFEGRKALVLERVQGETLWQAIQRHGALPITEALRIGVKLAEALEAAHRRGVVHRDLKPRNLMLGQNGVVKVLDFGLAQVEERESTVPLDASSGTSGYMSPEQMRGEKQDERTDLFAFGCVLFECLAGVKAFSGAAGEERNRAVFDNPPQWELLPALTPPRVRALLERCLAKDAAARPASASEVRSELEDALGIRRVSALGGTPNNLPRQASNFIGREDVLERCLALLAKARVLTLTGVGGSGKTRVALELAQRLLETRTDGVWFVDLASLADPARVAQAVTSAAGIAEEPGRPLEDTLAAALTGKRLLVLDNCEHLLEACARIAVRLEGIQVLATSREVLGVPGEVVFPVPTLALPADLSEAARSEAVRLFVERAPSFTLDAGNTEAVVEICRRLDGIPLAIELAAARVRLLSVDEIRKRLDDRFRLLTGGSRTAMPRHQTLRAAMQWSYDLLTPDEQELLRTLAGFAGSWALEAAFAVFPRDPFVVLDLLTHLEHKSLLVVERPDEGEMRFRMLETVRQYARELLMAGGGGKAARDAHRDHYLAFAEHANAQLNGPHQAFWLSALELDIDNLRAALDWSMETDLEAAVRMAGAMQWLWIMHGHVVEGLDRLEALIARADELQPGAGLAGLYHAAGNFWFRIDRYDLARARYEQALALREQIGDERGIAGTLGALGNVAQYEGRFDEAIALFERSLERNRASGNRVWEAANLTCLGNCHRAMGRLAETHAYYEPALALNREIGNRNGEAFVLDALGCVALLEGEFAKARGEFEQALAIQRQLENAHEIAVLQLGLGSAALGEDDRTRARAHYADAIPAFVRLKAQRQLSSSFDGLCRLALREGDPERATRMRAVAETLRQGVGITIALEPDAGPDVVESLRAALGQAEFERAWAEGAALTVEEAMADGLGAGLPR